MENKTFTPAQSETKTVVLVSKWGSCANCEGCRTMVNAIFKDDNECSCGCAHHHYHCSICGCVTQVG